MVKAEAVLEINSTRFNEILEKEQKLVVVDFYAEWCMPCLMISPVLNTLANKHKDAKFVKINVDENQELAEEFEIQSLPCVVFIKEGREVDRLVGKVSDFLLQEKIDDYI
jgi:thioredoxin 1